jgi:MFS family permease
MNGKSSLNKQNPTISKKTWFIVFMFFFLYIINFADKAIVGFAAAPIMEEFNLTPTQFGFLGSAFFFLFSISAIVVSSFSDYIGPRRVLSGMSIIWATVQFATILIASYPLLLASRIILGAGEGPTNSVTNSAVARILPKEKLSLGATAMMLGTNAGPAIMAPILAVVIAQYGWRSGFLLLGVIGVIWLVLWQFFVKEKDLTLHSNIEKKSSESESKSKQRVDWKEVFKVIKSVHFITIVFSLFASYWIISIQLVWFPYYFANALSLNPGQLGFLNSLPWLAPIIPLIFFSMLSDRLYKKTASLRKGRVFVAAPIVILTGICIGLASIVQSPVLSVIFIILTAACNTIIHSVGPAIISVMAKPEIRGTVLGISNGLLTSSAIIAPAITGAIIENYSGNLGFQYAFGIPSILLIISGLLFLIFCRPDKMANTSPRMKTTVEETIIIS